MLHLTHAIDRASGYVYTPASTSVKSHPPDAIPPGKDTPASHHPNTYSLFSSAMGPLQGPMSDIRYVQERWLDARDAWDAFEKRAWRAEGEAVQERAARTEATMLKEKNMGEDGVKPKKRTVRIRPNPNRSSEMDVEEGFDQ